MMGWGIEQEPDGTWTYWCASSAYGCILGGATTKAEAEQLLLTAETWLYHDE
jgi:hypothetical protein